MKYLNLGQIDNITATGEFTCFLLSYKIDDHGKLILINKYRPPPLSLINPPPVPAPAL